jgi:hypothetical protein
MVVVLALLATGIQWFWSGRLMLENVVYLAVATLIVYGWAFVWNFAKAATASKASLEKTVDDLRAQIAVLEERIQRYHQWCAARYDLAWLHGDWKALIQNAEQQDDERKTWAVERITNVALPDIANLLRQHGRPASASEIEARVAYLHDFYAAKNALESAFDLAHRELDQGQP